MRNKKIVAGLLLFSLVLFSLLSFHKREATENRQAEIRDLGPQVMPFDLDKTTHVFQRTDTGGLQQVRVKNLDDKEQITLIQHHLRQETERFAQGDFSDPATLHGDNMPGLSVLEKAQGKFTVDYADLPNGGQILYTTSDEEVLEAFHLWFMAQLQDHGQDAMEHM